MSKLNRIVFISNSSYGMYNFRLGLMKSLLNEGCEVFVVAPQDEYTELLKKEGINIFDWKIKPRGVNPLQELNSVFQLYRILKQINAEIVVSYTIKPTLYVALIKGILGATKSVAVVTGLGHVFTSQGFISGLAKKFYQIVFKFHDKVLFLNDDDQKVFLELKIVNKARSLVLPSEGVDTKRFKASSLAFGNEHFTFALIGRMLREKGIYEFAHAAAMIKDEFPNAKFLLLGPLDNSSNSGISEGEMRDLVADFPIEYCGQTKDVFPFIDNTDCVVLPSFYREGVPRILLEAISMERPIVTTNQVGCKEVVIDGENGFLVPVKDAKALAQAMKKILKMDKDELKKMGERGRAYAQNRFDEEKIIEIYDMIFRELFASRSVISG